MYTMRLVCADILGQWSISGAIAGVDESGEWKTLSTFADIVSLPEQWAAEDATASIIEAIRQWAEMTSQG